MDDQVELRSETVATEKGSQFWTNWNNFVVSFGNDALSLEGFVKYYMKAAYLGGWTPRLLTMEANGRLVGAAALRTKGPLGVRRAKSLMPFGTDFVINPAYREAFVSNMLTLLLKKLKCQHLDFILPSESPNLDSLRQACESLHLRFDTVPVEDDLVREHSVIQVQGTWSEYAKMRGRNFVRRFKRNERKLRNAGRFRIERAFMDSPEPVDEINTVEMNSWKNAWRKGKGINRDSGLDKFFDYVKSLPGTLDRKSLPRLWLLELNDEPIAYEIVLQLNGVALLCKTSFDDRYKELSPGDYLQSVVIRDLFDSGEVSKIDFLIARPYHNRWTSLREKRLRLVISKDVPLLSPLISTAGRSLYLRAAYKNLRNRPEASDLSPISQSVNQNPVHLKNGKISN